MATPRQPAPQDGSTPVPGVKLRVGFVLADRFTLTAFAGFVDAIRLAADDGDRSRQIDCEWAVLGDERHLVRSSCGISLQVSAPMAEPQRFDYIVVVGGVMHDGQKIARGTNAFLIAAAKAGIPLIGLCTGSFILARAGLLDGYEACVSWLHRDEFQAEFPDLPVQSDTMFSISRDRVTCAGGTSVVHLAAHLIEKHCGRPQALKSLRIMIEDQGLPIGAWQPEAVLTTRAQDSVVRHAMLLIEQTLGEPESLTDLAVSLDLSPRQLERRFIADVGISPRDYRLRLRLARAKWMVEHTDRAMTDIGLECGFYDGSYFSRAFRKHFGEHPSSARKTSRLAGAKAM